MKIVNPQLFTKPLLQLLFTSRPKRGVRFSKASRMTLAESLIGAAMRRKLSPEYVAVGMIELHYAIHRIAFMKEDPVAVEVGRTNEEFANHIKPFYDEAFKILTKGSQALITEVATEVVSNVVSAATAADSDSANPGAQANTKSSRKR